MDTMATVVEHDGAAAQGGRWVVIDGRGRTVGVYATLGHALKGAGAFVASWGFAIGDGLPGGWR